MLRKFTVLFTKYPISRGMVVYAILWPSSDLCRQLATSGIQKDKTTPVDLPRLARFSLFGTLWVAPTVFTWVKISSRLIPGSSLRVAAVKAILEQFTYGPFSIISFYFGMNLLEGKSSNEAWHEVENKFLQTWKTGVKFWPVVQTFNFALIPERNRVVFVGLASFIWTAYLSFMEASSS
ncbi:hypothetical protein DAPPUDRAFT_191208 [Daphnia pulex]|uniref:Mpv17-like protein n=1 Tax=Daphnia pulex TaxID=6669 RepID=E9FW18_DAPPU|nr:hypothetical protein DAPPUDRAFT_191208 [Daphnia pulex]|eukprot:EFX89001.1 hypothetical protein DAPPUDRAFT_191208 [Daphnia pulex]